jgi:CRISPR-associated protein Cas1
MQYKMSFSDSFRLNQGKAVVRGKLQNYKNWLQHKQRRKAIECAKELASIGEAMAMIDFAADANELMGIEGIATKSYFEGFRKNIRQNIGFHERNRRPPKDPVNAMLSFGYTILLHKVLAAIERAGLDPFIANLHANQNGRPSLALDMMEEFRLFIVDMAVARIVNLARVKPGDFIITSDQGVKMKEATIALLVKEIQARASSCVMYLRDKRKIEVQDQILRQAYHYKDVVNGEAPVYQPVVFNL